MNQSPSDGLATADKISLFAILITVFLSPLFLIPSAFVSFQFAKILLVFTGVIVAAIAWIIGRLKHGTIHFPRHYFFLALLAVPLVFVLSAAFSPVRSVSFMGQGYEVGTVAFIFILCLITFLTSSLFSSRKFIAYSYFSFLIVFCIVAFIQILRLFVGPQILTFKILTGATSSLVGGWNDLGIYFGLAALFSFLTLELLRLERWMKVMLWVLIVISFFFLSIISFSTVWYILAISAVIFFIYNFSFNRTAPVSAETGKRRHTVPLTSLVVLIISIIFILFQGNIYGTLSAEPFNIHSLQKFNISNVEARPSWTSTFMMIKDTFIHHPLLGVGPNRFANEWEITKPAAVNTTLFWSTDFSYGIGLIPTFMVTTGILGTIIWLVFLILFLYAGFKSLFLRTADTFGRYVSASSFIIALYLWIFAIFYVPSIPILVMTFFFTGLFFASLAENSVLRTSSFDFVQKPRTSFVSVLLFVVILLGIVTFAYAASSKFLAAIYYNKGLDAANNSSGNLTDAENNLLSAVRLSNTDLYYRTLASMYLSDMNTIIGQQGVSQDTLQSQFKTALSNASASAQAAVNADPTNYQNWLALGSIASSVVQYGVNGAYTSASTDYAKAQSLDPENPIILLSMAQLEMANKDDDKAKADIASALKMKTDYTDALFLLAQIQANENDLPSAIQSVEDAVAITPNDPSSYFELGLLKYDSKDYQGAASALEQAITLSPGYANAEYFLGLSDYQLGNVNDAIQQFTALQSANPTNTEIPVIINNLKAGKDPLAGLQQAAAPTTSTTATTGTKTTPPVTTSTSTSSTPKSAK